MPQKLRHFRVPEGFRGRSKVEVQLWWIVQETIFAWSPQFAYPFRAWLLRRFGATVGRRVLLRPSAKFTYPWKITLGDDVWVGDNAVLYSLGEITVASDSVVSQGCYLCAGDHDYRVSSFPIRARPITVGSGAWLAADVFVAPGVKIEDGVVVGARSSVFSDLPKNYVCFGSPCKPVKPRECVDVDLDIGWGRQ
ncbi:colanic acid biosynthesis acetyltransferase WcaF [Ramlibacter monticola]|uniref:Colanic acid biosynthesis acetyltransferase WcaF n=1 Tax=Ramlibacter monticola TaxID=1926872 RepID=A0A937CUY7_9BURK|nr:WcaF family extracellular polysaccharide biosynthesis acetyltransferase [Ramlibacter monticola]MBL0394125.1 colanic acid biosynthesis acetyltransferase WcaF [Ramlibacter monticola]